MMENLDALELVLVALKEHEKKLDDIAHRLEQVEYRFQNLLAGHRRSQP